MSELKECKYRLPCGWCDRKNEKCELLQESVSKKSIQKREFIVECTPYQIMCNHEWTPFNKTSFGHYHYYCYKCGATKTVTCE